MTPSPAQPHQIATSGGAFPLHEFHLTVGGREWTVLHTGVILTHTEEAQYLRDLPNRPPYGVVLWPSAIALAHELAARGADALAGKTVLELGAGTGLPGIVAASLGARVVQTDGQELALEVCKRNSRGNDVGGIEHRLADWNDWRDETRYDWILGSDILYAEPAHARLTHIFGANLAPGGRVLLGDPFRGVSVRFLESLEEQGWKVAATKWNLGGEGGAGDPRAIGIFELWR
jgi:predicted nicotinamide N-methyase